MLFRNDPMRPCHRLLWGFNDDQIGAYNHRLYVNNLWL